MFHRFSELGAAPCLVRSTDFTYTQSPIASFINAVTQSGYIRKSDGTYLKKSLPELEFEYSKAQVDDTVRAIDPDTGPYTNVSASLTLNKSELRNTPKLGSTHLKIVPRSRSVTVATSSAQNDAGVFELNFSDERYMPFEGGGAISSWQLSLPENFRQFDYQTISTGFLSKLPY